MRAMDVKRYEIYGADEDGPHHVVNSAGQTADNIEDGTKFVLASDFDAVLKDRDALQGKLKVAVDELSTSGCKPDAASDCKLCRLLAQIGLPEKEGGCS